MATSEAPCLWGDDGSAVDAGKYRKDSPPGPVRNAPRRAPAPAGTPAQAPFPDIGSPQPMHFQRTFRHARRSTAALLISVLAAGASFAAIAAAPVGTGKPVALEGELDVLVEDHADGHSVTHHFLKTTHGRVELKLNRKAPNLQSGTRTRVPRCRFGALRLSFSSTRPCAVLRKWGVTLWPSAWSSTSTSSSPSSATGLPVATGAAAMAENETPAARTEMSSAAVERPAWRNVR